MNSVSAVLDSGRGGLRMKEARVDVRQGSRLPVRVGEGVKSVELAYKFTTSNGLHLATFCASCATTVIEQESNGTWHASDRVYPVVVRDDATLQRATCDRCADDL